MVTIVTMTQLGIDWQRVEQHIQAARAIIEESVSDASFDFIAFQVECNVSVDWLYARMNCGMDARSMLFYDPDVKSYYLALGEAVILQENGSHRFQTMESQLRQLRSRVYRLNACDVRLFGGCSFAVAPADTYPMTKSATCADEIWQAWPDRMFWLPEMLFIVQDNRPFASVVFCISREVCLYPERQADWMKDCLLRMAHVESDLTSQSILTHACKTPDNPMQKKTSRLQGSQEQWVKMIEQATAAIQNEQLHKVVLARSKQMIPGVSLASGLHALHTLYPDNFLFAIGHQGQYFVGSSPERLVSLRHGIVQMDCLAGTEQRGQTVTEDEQLGQALLTNRKNLREHAAVVNWMRDRVSGLVRELQLSDYPQLKKLANVQHLHTPLHAKLVDGVEVTDLLETIHPTPAVSGVPQNEAMQYIAAHETIDRGWYAGPVGWIDLDGDGTFAVALRSGLLSKGILTLYAGAGIMEDSDPNAEWVETEMKLQPMSQAFACREWEFAKGDL